MASDAKPAWTPTFDRSDVNLESQETAYDGFFKIRRLTLNHPRFEGGSLRITRELFKRGNAVCVLLYDPQRDAVVLIEQFRIGALAAPSPWMLELVAGMIEDGETADQVAIREAQEEAGLELRSVRPISRFLTSGGGSDEWIDLMYAEVDSTAAGGVHGLATEGEDIKVHVLAAEQTFELVRQGAVNSAPAIIALQWLELNRDRLKD